MAENNNILKQATSGLPKGWQLKKLGEVCHTTSGGTPSRQNASYYNGNIPWVKSGELDKGLILDTEEKISEEAIKNSSAKVFPKGTLLIALYGATIGKLAFLGVDAATNQAICGIFKNENIDSNYLYHFLFYKKSNLVNQGIGGAQPNISQGILKNLDVPIPPLAEQQLIVAKVEELLSELENGKQQLQIAQQQLKVYRQSLLKWAFEGKLTNSWRESRADLPSAKELQLQIEIGRNTFYQNQLKEWKHNLKIWSDKGQLGKKPSKPKTLTNPDKPNVEQNEKKWNIPKNWIWSQFGIICFVTKLAGFEYTDYVKYDDNGDLPVLKAENVGQLGFKETVFSKIKTEDIRMLTRSQLFGGELIIVFVGAGTGNVAMVPFNYKYFLGPNIGMARPYLKINSKYLELFYQSIFGKNLMLSAVKAVAQPSLSMGTIRQTPIAFPSIEEQDKIIEELESKLTVCDKIEQTISQSLQQAETLRQSILKQAFEGKLTDKNNQAK